VTAAATGEAVDLDDVEPEQLVLEPDEVDGDYVDDPAYPEFSDEEVAEAGDRWLELQARAEEEQAKIDAAIAALLYPREFLLSFVGPETPPPLSLDEPLPTTPPFRPFLGRYQRLMSMHRLRENVFVRPQTRARRRRPRRLTRSRQRARSPDPDPPSPLDLEAAA
jgi:hypothetical protein